MKLIGSQTSPYVRKVRIVMLEKRIDHEFVEEAPWSQNTHVPDYNPLGKVPVLAMDDGGTLFDSRVIAEYLDTVTPLSRLLPDDNRPRILVKRWEALADGISDAAVAIVLETRRPQEQQSMDWIARQQSKVERGLQACAEGLDDRAWCNGENYSLADIALGCTLGYLDLRFPQLDWRELYPNLAKFEAKLAKRQSFQDTAPPRS
ncbi:MAG: glutathione S-transferase [Pseudomonadota bacterium]